MTPSDTSARARRAAARKERRSSDETTNEPSGESNGTGSPAALAGDALRAAASAAAVGAAVGAARALSARRRSAPDDEPPVEDSNVDEEEERDRQPPESEAAPPQQPEPDEKRQADTDPEPASADELRTTVRRARALLGDLHGTDAESVSSVARTRSGWKVALEVLEVRRIPDSTDILATYEVELDDDGRVLGFERTRRYHRAQADNGGRG